MSKRVAIENVLPGMFIIAVTQQQGPVSIRKSGLVTSTTMVQALAQMGVTEVAIDPDLTVDIAVDDASPNHVAVATEPRSSATQRLLRQPSIKPAAQIFSSAHASLSSPLLLANNPLWWQRWLWPAQLLLVILGGCAIGFTLATPAQWWPAWQQPWRASPQVSLSVPVTAVVPTSTTALPSSSTAVIDPLPPSPSVAAETPVELSAVTEEETAPVTISPQLLQKFNQALAEIEAEKQQREQANENPVTATKPVLNKETLPRIDQLPARLLTRLPAMTFSAHMYASDPEERWVRVNGQQLMEGDWIAEEVQIINIEGQQVILSFQGELFRMAALTSW